MTTQQLARHLDVDGEGFRRYRDSLGWRPREDDSIEVEGMGVPRTSGRPMTVTANWLDYRGDLLYAAERFGLPPLHLLGVLLVEAWPPVRGFHRDPRNVREEPGYASDEATPKKISSGLMHTLLSTAAEMCEEYGLFGGERQTRQDLWTPHRSIVIGAAYCRWIVDHLCGGEYDPMLVQAAYNRGKVRYSERDARGDNNAFRLAVFDADRHMRFIRFVNDAVAAGLPR